MKIDLSSKMASSFCLFLLFFYIQITHPKADADAPVVPLALHVAVDVVTLVAVAAAVAAGAAVDVAVVTRAFRKCEDVAA